ncbi:HPP family protein [Bacillus sp. V3B]|uniref:HPP family protein n=1 Tax=Bacillus sp. V3B TaxID=2804915 RepID=UPI00210D86A1|nr:HPP family protein [Bacillus sp. V3B]MCQ6277479.1 HPP family protein [Bacillus sp. V3B]
MIRVGWILCTLALVVVMYGLGEWTNKDEIIFPEVAALAIGSWIYSNQEWTKNHFHFWFSPTIAAIIGVGIQFIFPFMQTLPLIIIVYVLTANMLYVLNSLVAPSLSAALLPVLLEVNSWYYVLSVLSFTIIIALVKVITNNHKSDSSITKESSLKPKKRNWVRIEDIIHWSFTGILLIFVSLLATKTGWLYLMAPPLIVMLFEFTKKNSVLSKKPIRLIALMFVSSLWGVICYVFLYQIFHMPLWIVASLIVFTIIFIFRIIQLPFPPAAAISLLPTIIHLQNVWFYPLQILLGVSLFVFSGVFYHKRFNTLYEFESDVNSGI